MGNVRYTFTDAKTCSIPYLGRALNDKLNYIIFWKWEYLRRNENTAAFQTKESASTGRFPATYNVDKHVTVNCAIEELLKNDSEDQFVIDAPPHCYCLNKNNAESLYVDSGKLLGDIIDNKLQYSKPRVLQKSCRESISSISYNRTKNKTGLVRMTIDFDCNINTIIMDIEAEYHRHKFIACNDPGSKKHIEKYSLVKSKASSGGLRRIRTNNAARAIGLWLFDYVEEKKIPWEHRAKSYAAFREQYQNPNKPDLFIKGYTKDSQLAELLSKTRECIEKMEVLPVG